MFDIGGLELLLIAVVALLVIGPERLPETLRTLGLWLGRLRRSFSAVKAEIEKEIGMDEVRRQLHNEAVMEEMKRIEREVQNSVDASKIDPEILREDIHRIDPKSESDTSADTPANVTAEAGIDNPSDEEEAPTPPRPRSEAELEAAHERKMRAQQTAGEDNS